MWEMLSEQHMRGALLKSRQYALICLAVILRGFLMKSSFVENSNDDSAIKTALEQFTEYVIESSAYHMPETFRIATVKALRFSGLLKVTHSFARIAVFSQMILSQIGAGGVRKKLETSLFLRLWSVLALSLEDEDDAVRQAACDLVQSLPGTQMPTEDSSGHTVSVKLHFFECMTQRFNGQQVYLKYLLETIFDKKTAEMQTSIATGKMRRLFDKEDDNRYQEILFNSQAAAMFALEQLQRQPCKNTVNDWVALLLNGFLESAQQLKEMERVLEWKGQLSTQGEIFVALYRRLLGLWIVLEADLDIERDRTTLDEVISCLGQLPLHTYLQNLLVMVQKKGIEMESASRINKSADFDPLFLLMDRKRGILSSD